MYDDAGVCVQWHAVAIYLMACVYIWGLVCLNSFFPMHKVHVSPFDLAYVTLEAH